MQILTAEEGYFTPSGVPGGKDEWHVLRILNGDETDRGIRFPAIGSSTARTAVREPVGGDPAPETSASRSPSAVRIVLGRFLVL